jgi:hypothetical protein
VNALGAAYAVVLRFRCFGEARMRLHFLAGLLAPAFQPAMMSPHELLMGME